MFRRDLTLAPDGRSFEAAEDTQDVAEQRPVAGHELDFERIRLILRRNRWLVIACLILFPLGAIFLTATATPQYRATASIQLEQQSTRVLKGDEPQSGDSNIND